jgi:hypothetical protein
MVVADSIANLIPGWPKHYSFHKTGLSIAKSRAFDQTFLGLQINGRQVMIISALKLDSNFYNSLVY